MRHANGLLPNGMALSYIVLAYIGGFLLISRPQIVLNLAGVLLLAHAMVIAAYMIHECAHNTVFSRNEHNAQLGKILLWVTGAAYGKYEDIRAKHFRHHVDRADVVAFDYRTRLARYPVLLKIMLFLEWFYIPAVELMMHALVVILPFIQEQRKHLRRHVLIVLSIRATVFLLLIIYAPRIAIFYPLAYMLFLTVMRFMDTHQHTFEVFETLDKERGDEARRFDAAYEQRNTYSNLVSQGHPWLNLLTLNFGYHNAHHEKPIVPWYQLPALHAQLYGNVDNQVLPFSNLLISYHRYRLQRVLNADDGDIDIKSAQGRTFVGVDGVSFLTAH